MPASIKSCALAAITAHYPGACLIVKALLTEVIGVPVKEHCTHRQSPSCCFESELKQSALVSRLAAEKSYRTHGHIALAGDAIRAEIWAYFGTHLARRFAS